MTSRLHQDVEILAGRRGERREHAVRFKDLDQQAQKQSALVQSVQDQITSSGIPSIRDKIEGVRAFLHNTITYVDEEVQLARDDFNDARDELEAATDDLQTLIDQQGVTIVGIQSDVAGNSAGITQEAAARATADDALSGQITTIIADVGDNAAAIQDEQVARADADSALAGQITTITADVGDNAAAITAEELARANADSALSGQITNITADVGDNSAAIQDEQFARVGADNAISADVTNLSSRMGSAEADIQEASQTLATLEGYAAATYTLRVQAGSAGAALELVAADDPVSGAQSALRLSADDILLDGSVLATHLDVEDLAADFGFISELTSQTAFINELTVDTQNLTGVLNANKINFDGSVLKNTGGELTLTEGGVTTPLIRNEAVTDSEVEVDYYYSLGASDGLGWEEVLVLSPWVNPAGYRLLLNISFRADQSSQSDIGDTRWRLQFDNDTVYQENQLEGWTKNPIFRTASVLIANPGSGGKKTAFWWYKDTTSVVLRDIAISATRIKK